MISKNTLNQNQCGQLEQDQSTAAVDRSLAIEMSVMCQISWWHWQFAHAAW